MKAAIGIPQLFRPSLSSYLASGMTSCFDDVKFFTYGVDPSYLGDPFNRHSIWGSHLGNLLKTEKGFQKWKVLFPSVRTSKAVDNWDFFIGFSEDLDMGLGQLFQTPQYLYLLDLPIPENQGLWQKFFRPFFEPWKEKCLKNSKHLFVSSDLLGEELQKKYGPLPCKTVPPYLPLHHVLLSKVKGEDNGVFALRESQKTYVKSHLSKKDVVHLALNGGDQEMINLCEENSWKYSEIRCSDSLNSFFDSCQKTSDYSGSFFPYDSYCSHAAGIPSFCLTRKSIDHKATELAPLDLENRVGDELRRTVYRYNKAQFQKKITSTIENK